MFLLPILLIIFPFSQVILSTNIAESSVTVPDVKYGTSFCPLYQGFLMHIKICFFPHPILLQWLTSAWHVTWFVTQIPIFSHCVLLGHLKPAATSVEVQHAQHKTCDFESWYINYLNAIFNMSGRAGRVSKGYCYRLVTKEFWSKEIPDYMIPEMLVRFCVFWVFFVCFFNSRFVVTACALNFNSDTKNKTIDILFVFYSACLIGHHHIEGKVAWHWRSSLNPLHSPVTPKPQWHCEDSAATERGNFLQSEDAYLHSLA